ncbi:MAG: hypothetical protein J6U54_15935 [Clostridiales bacterium]|nr:hypothetical protein [Clostridiales bacterium]
MKKTRKEIEHLIEVVKRNNVNASEGVKEWNKRIIKKLYEELREAE